MFASQPRGLIQPGQENIQDFFGFQNLQINAP